MDVELAALGRKISELRNAQGWRLVDLASAAGYTPSYISQIERGVSIPSLTALATVAIALGVEMTALLEDFAGPTVTVTRSDEGNLFRVHNGQEWRTITRLGSERPYTAQTHSVSTEPTAFRHFGERFMVILEGELNIGFGDDKYHIGTLCTIHYGAHEEHVIQAASDDLELLIVSSPALF